MAIRAPQTVALLLLLASLPAQSANKPQVWREARSPRFTVMTNGSEKQARRVLGRFEQIRQVFQAAFPRMKVDTSAPIFILAAQDEKTFNAHSPEAWQKRGQLKRSGVFLRGPEKNLVLLRLDMPGDELYRAVFHEYTHLLIHQNVSSLPLWVNEGLAEFYAHTRILDKEFQLGYPSEHHVRYLRENRMIPLATLFSVDHTSPYYNEEHKGSIFYAQSWALVHYLMAEGFKQSKSPLAAFLALLHQGVEPVEAAQRAFGNLSKLESALVGYVNAAGYNFWRSKTEIDDEDNTVPVREVSPAESAALRGDFLAHFGERSAARALLEEGVRLDPTNALSYESLGLIELREKNLAEAGKWFEKAVSLDSGSYLAHFYFAAMVLQKGAGGEDAKRIEESLRAVIKINPGFGPAYDALANHFGMRGENFDEAHKLSLQAVQLEPGNARFRVTVANVLLRRDRPDDAVRVLEAAVTMAKSTEESQFIQSFLDQARQYQSRRAEAQRQEVLARAEAEEFKKRVEAAREAAAEREKREEAEAAEQAARAVQGPPGAKGAPGWMAGRIVAVSCKNPPALDLTLQGTLSSLRLHTANYVKMEFTSTTWTPPDPFDPCKHLLGRSAAVSYRKLGDSSSGGEIVSLEVRK